ncbi:condensin-2 complex subunit D3 [Mantella aurantiaca]
MDDTEAAVLEALCRFGLRSLSKVWVDSVWELEFTESEPLDSRIEAEILEHGVEAFVGLYNGLLPFASADPKNTRSVWALFTENDICRNSLVAVLYHFVCVGEKKNVGFMQKMLALHAAGLYFLLLEIPGSVANQVFHPLMFDKCLDTVEKCWPQDSDSSRKRKKDTVKSSQGDKRGNKKRSRPVRKGMELDDISEDEAEDDVYFSTRDFMQLRDAIILLLKNFLRLLPQFSLKDRQQSILHCMQIFINLTSFETLPQQLSFSDCINLDRLNYVPELAFHGLWLLCQPRHGEIIQTVTRLFHRLLSVILMVKGGPGSNLSLIAISAPVTSARDYAVQFVCFLVDKLKEMAVPVLIILLQHICAKCPDKSDYRLSAAQALLKLQDRLPNVEYASFLNWLSKYSRNPKNSYRAFALDASMALLGLPERVADASFPQENLKFLQHKFLIQAIIFSRCSDKAPTVRSKALSCLAQFIEKNAVSEGVQELLQGSSCRAMSGASSHCTTESLVNGTEASNHTRKTISELRTIEVSEASDQLRTDGRDVMATLRVRAGDQKTNVRKSAIQVLTSILKYNMIPCSSEALTTLQDRCRDPAVSVRKQSLTSLTELLQAQSKNVLVQKAWLTGLVPVVMDTETSIQEKTLEYLDLLILQNIRHYKSYKDKDEKQKLTWDLLQLLTTECQDLSGYLTKAFHLWAKQNKFSSTLINNLISHTDTEHAVPAWMVLANVAISAPKLDYTKILNTWEDISRQDDADSNSITVHVLCVIGHIAKHLPADTRMQLIGHLQSWLKEFKRSPGIIAPAIDSLQQLCYAQFDTPVSAKVLLDEVFGDLVSICEEGISSLVMLDTRQFDHDLMIRYIFTLGDAAQCCPARVGKRVLLLVQSLLATPEQQGSVDSMNEDLPQSQSQSQPPSQPLTQFRGSRMPSEIRAHAFFTLGKLCLQHEDLAKKCIPALARELEVSDDFAIRNNVVIVICDLCVRYTTMVDRYIPNVSMCLKDREPFVRRQTLIMLTNLLQEDFIKWKGSLFFHFISVLVDPDQDIAKFGEFCLVHLLLKRNPVMFSQHFIECIFYFNAYEKHEKYKFSQSERERNRFSLKGNENKEKRRKIYKFLLEHFTDEQRFNLTNKISQNVLAYFVDGLCPIDKGANDLLSDIFEIMRCKEIKLSAMRSKPGEDVGGDDENAMANAVIQDAQKKLISQVQKKNFIENIIPIISSLKGLLEEKHMPAVRELMHCLREMMQDYRNEIKDFFAADKQLAAEIEYDFKRYEEQLEWEKMENNLAHSMTNCAVTGSPQVSAPAGSHRSPNAGRSPLSTIKEPPGAGSNTTPISRTSILPGQGARPRLSLSTQAIINNAKKLAEGYGKSRSKSMGAQPSSNSANAKLVSSRISDQQSSGIQEGRAISTPERTIHNVTFGAGVSYISANQSLSSSNSMNASREQKRDILCMMSPDKPAPQPRQWNIESPLQRRQNCSRSTRKRSLQ